MNGKGQRRAEAMRLLGEFLQARADEPREGESRYAELFGTPERAARTLSVMQRCELGIIGNCDECELHDACRVRDGDYDALLEWLRGDVE